MLHLRRGRDICAGVFFRGDECDGDKVRWREGAGLQRGEGAAMKKRHIKKPALKLSHAPRPFGMYEYMSGVIWQSLTSLPSSAPFDQQIGAMFRAVAKVL
jgi:hypothetical protein